MIVEQQFQRRVHEEPISGENWHAIRVRFALTRRELAVARLLCRGLSNMDIASQLRIAYPTLRSHVRSIYHKLGCVDRVDMILTLVEFEKNSTWFLIPRDD